MSKSNISVGTKVRFYPSGMAEVSGDDPDEVALIGAAIAKGIYRHGLSQAVAAEIPLANGAGDSELPLPPPPAKPHDHSPFIDLSVTQHHPAILALERDIIGAATGAIFGLKHLRTFVGHHITGVWRECQTRSVGKLMARLTDTGVVTEVGAGKWQKLARIK
jgi:hypothetical protein